ncbi:MAG: pilus assembly protein N-terminal domain-containing protein, partial [bacterium]
SGLSAWLFAVAFALLMHPVAIAQQVVQAGYQVDEATINQVDLIVGTSRNIRFDYKISEVLVENPDVVTAAAPSPNEIRLTGMKPGASSLTVKGADSNQQVIVVNVTADIRRLQAALATFFPDCSIKILALNEGVILGGNVAQTDQVEKITNWVRAGGVLICEACPGYFGPGGRAGTKQPNLGLDTLFGVEEEDVEVMPDIADRNSIFHRGDELTCAGFRQAYRATSGTALANFDTGQTAIVENRFGAGRTMLIGSHLSASYHYHPNDGLRTFFGNLLTWAGHEPAVSNSNPRVQARLHADGDRFWLWLVNPERVAQEGRLIADVGGAQPEQAWGGADSQFSQGLYRVPAQDALVVELPPAK